MRILILFLCIFSAKVARCLKEPTSSTEYGNLEESPPSADKNNNGKENESHIDLSVQSYEADGKFEDHFSNELKSIIRQTITNLLSPSNPQIISFLLTILPVFPPAAIVGSFIMVILSILQNPTLLSFMQKMLQDLNSFAMNFNNDEISIPDHIFEWEKRKTSNMLEMLNEGEIYAPKLAMAASKKMKLQDLDLLRNLGESNDGLFGIGSGRNGYLSDHDGNAFATNERRLGNLDHEVKKLSELNRFRSQDSINVDHERKKLSELNHFQRR